MVQVIKKIKDNKKASFYIGALVVLFIILLKYFNNLRNYLSSSVSSIGTNLTNETASSIVEILKEAFTNFIPYSSFDTLKVQLKDISKADYFKIKQVFGLQWRSFATGGVATGLQANSIFAEELNLTQWISKELKAEQIDELKQLNPIFNEIL